MSKLFPDGLLCMESALYAYGYISRKPVGFHIAVDKNTSKSRFKMEYPKVIGDKIYLSAKENESLNVLTELILNKIYADYVTVTFLIPYEKGGLVSYFMENAQIISQKYEENGTRLTVKCYLADKEKYGNYIIEETCGE